jgi:hypothetical protein
MRQSDPSNRGARGGQAGRSAYALQSHPPPGRARAEGEEMSVVANRPWTSHEDIILQRLAAAGKYHAAIAAEITRGEATIRTHAALLNLTLTKEQRGPKAKATAK